MIPPSEDEQKTYILLLYNVKKEPATVGTETTFNIISLIPPDVKKCAFRGAKIKI